MKMQIAAIFVIAVIFVSGCAVKPDNTPLPSPSPVLTRSPTPTPTQTPEPKLELSDLKKFSSIDEIKDFIKNNTVGYNYYGAVMPLAATAATKSTASVTEASVQTPIDYSKTNIQVEGVDEPDIVKTDGNYIYAVSGRKTIGIIEAYPAENSKLLSKIEINGTVQEIFVNKDRLVIFGQGDARYGVSEKLKSTGLSIATSAISLPYGRLVSSIKVYDISDKSNPILEKDFSFNGNYLEARMIGSWVYFVINNQAYGEDPILPLESQTDVHYFDIPSDSYMFTLVGTLNVEKDELEVASKTFLIPSTQSLFASLDNIYITHLKFYNYSDEFRQRIKEVYLPVLPENLVKEIMQKNESDYQKDILIHNLMVDYKQSLPEGEKEELNKKLAELEGDLEAKRKKTVIYKISVKDSEIKLVAKGEIPGRILNQFSMDEFNGDFRIATTTGNRWDKSSRNHVYVLDADLKVMGKIENLAPGESIYSVRFMGERAYLVTFKKVDPLFVIDLKDPQNPKILGKLKIPGFSDYLHPYDQDHIIGIGKEAVEAEQGDFAWYQGVKLALFDVSDPENPREVSKFVIGDRGTDSYALRDHKAFLFSKEKNLLVIPVLLAEIQDKTQPPTGFEYGEFTFQGAYVFELTKENGFVLKGRITHVNDPESFKKSGYYYYGSGDSVKRSLYIGDVLYTISDKLIKANKISDIAEITSVELPYKEEGNFYPIAKG